MSTQILITDMMDVKHGESTLSVHQRKTKMGWQGVVKVTYRTGPHDSYKVPCDCNSRVHETDALADAIALRKDIIAMNVIGRDASKVQS